MNAHASGNMRRQLIIAAVLMAGFLSGGPAVLCAENNRADPARSLISVHVQNVDVQEFLRGLAKEAGINIVTGKGVAGTISASLHAIPLMDALEAVCRANGLLCRRENNIYLIVKQDESKERREVGTEVRGFRINYADVNQMRKVMEDMVGKDRVAVHKKSRTLIVEDAPENFSKVHSILQEIDYQPQQVLIEAKILEVTLGDSLALGVDWEKAFTLGDMEGTMESKDFSLSKETEGVQGFFFDIIKNNSRLKVALDALEQQSDVNVLATPKLIALDGRPAEIIIGGKLGYYLVTTTETSTLQSVEFLDTGTQLKMTPHVSKDNKILLEIHPEVSDGTVDAIGLPSTRTTEVSTSLLAEHGDTIFIGGLIRSSKERIKKRVPVLGSIPLFGALFGRTEEKENKTEIVVLITPYIVQPGDMSAAGQGVRTIERAEAVLGEKRGTVEKLMDSKRMIEQVKPAE